MKYILLIVGMVFVLVIGIMSLFAYLANKYSERATRKKLQLINDSSPFRGKKPLTPKPRKDDFRAKDKITEKRKQEESAKELARYDPNAQVVQETSQKDEVQIVGVAKPVGRWSSFISKQKLGFILTMMNLQKSSKQGYWVTMIKAQDAWRGKGKGQGR